MIRLSLGAEEHWRRRLVEAAILPRLDNSDDFVRRHATTRVDAHDAPDRAASAPISFRHGIVHDCHPRCTVIVAAGKLSPVKHWRAHRNEEIRPDVERLDMNGVVTRRRRYARYLDADDGPRRHERQIPRRTRVPNAWQRRDTVDQPPLEDATSAI